MIMSFMGVTGKGFNEEQEAEDDEEEEDMMMMTRRSRSSGKLPISSSSSHIQHTRLPLPLTHHQHHQGRVVVAAGNWLENKSHDQPKQEGDGDDDDESDDVRRGGGGVVLEREHMFDKVVTPSDVGKLNRLVIPKQHAEKYFPLDSSINEKGLLLNFEDRNGKPWRFRYSYWNSSQSYVMTKGWSRFVKDKKLDAGDVVSFHRGVGDLSKHRLFIDWRRRPPSTLDSPSRLHHHHHPPPPNYNIPTVSFPPTHHFSFDRSIQHQYQFHQHQHGRPPNYPAYSWRRTSPGQLLPPSPPPPPTTTTQPAANMSSRDHSQYLTLQPSTNHHQYYYPHDSYNGPYNNYGYISSSNSSSTVVANNINPNYSGGGPVMYLRSAAAAPTATPAGPQLIQEAGVGGDRMMMMMKMPRGGPDHEELGGGVLEPFVFESVPVVVQGKAAAAAKRLRLFGVNMEYYSPIEDDIVEHDHENSHHHECHILSSSSSNTTTTIPSHLLDKGKASMSLDLDI